MVFVPHKVESDIDEGWEFTINLVLVFWLNMRIYINYYMSFYLGYELYFFSVYKHKYLKDSLTCPFKKATVVMLCTWAYTFPSNSL